MIGNDHEVAGMEGGIDSSGGVGNKEIFYARNLHYPNGKGDLLHGISLVEVKTPLHGDYGFAAKVSGYEIATVTVSGGFHKVRNISIWNGLGIADPGGEVSESASENNSRMWLYRNAGCDVTGCVVITVHANFVFGYKVSGINCKKQAPGK
jgi:hypothetical protein